MLTVFQNGRLEVTSKWTTRSYSKMNNSKLLQNGRLEVFRKMARQKLGFDLKMFTVLRFQKGKKITKRKIARFLLITLQFQISTERRKLWNGILSCTDSKSERFCFKGEIGKIVLF